MTVSENTKAHEKANNHYRGKIVCTWISLPARWDSWRDAARLRVLKEVIAGGNGQDAWQVY